MKAIILTVLLIGALAINTDIESLWNTWKIQNNKDYPDYETEAARFAAFTANYIFVQEWNSDPTHTSQVALNLFADLTSEEFGAMYTGAIPADDEYVQAHIGTTENIEDPPSSWDWTEHGAVTPIKNQGQCGSCWAFSTVATSEGLYAINGGTLTSFSEQQIVDCDSTCDGCNGGWPYLAMKYVAANGLETESEYPYVAQQQQCNYNSANAIKTGVTGSAFVKPREPGLLNAQIYQQPVAVIVEADQSAFQLYSNGVLSQGCGTNLDHAITAVGYTSTYAIVKNSWGTTWGQSGYVWISTSAKINAGAGACGILLQPQYPTGISS